VGLESIFNAITQLLFLSWFKLDTLCEINSKKNSNKMDDMFSYANSLFIYIEKDIVTIKKE